MYPRFLYNKFSFEFIQDHYIFGSNFLFDLMKVAEKIETLLTFRNLRLHINFKFQEISNKTTAAGTVQIANIFKSNSEVPK